MASPFDDLDATASAALVAGFGEAAIIIPRAPAQYVESAGDADRDQHKVQGIFSAGPARVSFRGQSVGVEMVGATQVATAAAEFWMSAEQVAALPYAPKKGDLLVMVDQPGAPKYAVSARQPTDQGDLTLHLLVEDQA